MNLFAVEFWKFDFFLKPQSSYPFYDILEAFYRAVNEVKRCFDGSIVRARKYIQSKGFTSSRFGIWPVFPCWKDDLPCLVMTLNMLNINETKALMSDCRGVGESCVYSQRTQESPTARFFPQSGITALRMYGTYIPNQKFDSIIISVLQDMTKI